MVADQYDGTTVAEAILWANRNTDRKRKRPLYTGVAADRTQAHGMEQFLNTFREAMLSRERTAEEQTKQFGDNVEPESREPTPERKLNESIRRANKAARQTPRSTRKPATG